MQPLAFYRPMKTGLLLRANFLRVDCCALPQKRPYAYAVEGYLKSQLMLFGGPTTTTWQLSVCREESLQLAPHRASISRGNCSSYCARAASPYLMGPHQNVYLFWDGIQALKGEFKKASWAQFSMSINTGLASSSSWAQWPSSAP